MIKDTFNTIEDASEGEFKDKGSRFLAFAHPVSNEDEVKELLQEYKKKYYDARHVCYAYRIGVNGEKWRAVDDGEPSSTAGKPILGQLLSKELTNIAVYVIRYFGGTKLGVPGLINAYRKATEEAIKNSIVIEQEFLENFTIWFEYLSMNDVMTVVKETNPQVKEQIFDLSCTMRLAIRKSEVEELKSKLLNINGLKLEVEGDQE